MSRVGKQPVSIPNGVEVKIQGEKLIFKKGNVEKELDTKNLVNVSLEDNSIVFSSKSNDRRDRAFWGTFRSLSQNIIIGLNEGYTRKLEINGVGYRAAVKGNAVELQLGFSHPISYELPKGINATVEKNVITLTGDDKQVIGQVAAHIRGFRPPEPYKGKGVKYAEERIIRKAGKTSKK